MKSFFFFSSEILKNFQRQHIAKYYDSIVDSSSDEGFITSTLNGVKAFRGTKATNENRFRCKYL